ncbi:hypothetical protein GQA12_05130 [Paenibacillus alvei]|nr:hypothetical protein [Paenibacillus alvei]
MILLTKATCRLPTTTSTNVPNITSTNTSPWFLTRAPCKGGNLFRVLCICIFCLIVHILSPPYNHYLLNLFVYLLWK